MFTVNEQAIRAEDNYRRNLLRDQNHKTSKTGKTAVMLLGFALLFAACGVAPESNNNGRDVVAAVSDPGPSWAPNLSALETTKVAGIAVDSLGVFAGPTWMPNLDARPDYFPDYGVFAGPTWNVSQAAIDQALGIDRDPGLVGEMEPSGHPNYGRLETILGTGGIQTGPR